MWNGIVMGMGLQWVLTTLLLGASAQGLVMGIVLIGIGGALEMWQRRRMGL
jgi:hypothetical protein